MYLVLSVSREQRTWNYKMHKQNTTVQGSLE